MLRSRILTLLTLAPTSVPDKGSACITGQLETLTTSLIVKHFRTSSSQSRIFEVPDEAEVTQLKAAYPQPKKIISDLLKPLVSSGKIVEPRVDYVPKLNGQYWKAQLHINWPKPITFAGTHSSLDQAEENAYLLACQLFKNAGLLYQEYNDTHPVGKERVFSLLERLATISRVVGRENAPFELKSTRCYNTEGKPGWQSVLTVPWPYHFTVTDWAPTIQASHYSVCLLAYIKLKVSHLLQSDNLLAEDRVLSTTRQILRTQNYPTANEIDPHYQIYVDASRIGFGAYLLTKTENKVRWMSESWNDHFKADPDNAPPSDSCFYESYALTAACYTWKHKFVNKRVLCFSDNKHTVFLANSAASPVSRVFAKRHLKHFVKLYHIITDMCQNYNINLHALHVKRESNTAADYLSRVQVDNFKKIVPDTEEKAKKAKKLLFVNPIIPIEYDRRYRKVS